MPTYRNTSGSTKSFLGEDVAAGGYVGTKKYVDLAGYPDFELVKHTPLTNIPVLLFGAAPDGSTVTGLLDYEVLLIVNSSGAELVLTFNGSAANAMRLPSGQPLKIENLDHDYYSVTVTGSGTNPAYIHGIKGDAKNS